MRVCACDVIVVVSHHHVPKGRLRRPVRGNVFVLLAHAVGTRLFAKHHPVDPLRQLNLSTSEEEISRSHGQSKDRFVVNVDAVSRRVNQRVRDERGGGGFRYMVQRRCRSFDNGTKTRR